jgi:hypothetical protein
MMSLQQSPGCGAALAASLVAGPVFLLSLIAATIYVTLPDPVPLDPSTVFGIVLALIPATIVGFVLAFAPNLLGSAVMAGFAEAHEAVRDPFVWVGAGALAGTGLAALFAEIQSPGGFATIVTSAVCARICRAQFDWGPQA